jgi:hypothetical protein
MGSAEVSVSFLIGEKPAAAGTYQLGEHRAERVNLRTDCKPNMSAKNAGRGCFSNGNDADAFPTATVASPRHRKLHSSAAEAERIRGRHSCF